MAGEVIKFSIPLIPKGQQRARHGRRGNFSVTYKAKEQVHEENVLMTLIAQHRPSSPISGPVMLGCKAFFPIPKSKPEKWKVAARQGCIRHESTPDLDNILKQIKDILTTMRFWEDDKHVVEYLPGTGKYYSDYPRWEIEIRPFVANDKL